MKDVLLRIIRASVGLFIAGFGIYLTMQANIGLSPWDALNEGVAAILGIKFGTASVMIGFIVIGVDLLLREKIGYGTVLDAIIVGKSADFFTYLDILPVQTSIIKSIFFLICGLFVLSLSIYLYMSAALCAGPRDMLLVAIGKKFRKIPIGYVNMAVLAIVTAGGLFLGANIGIGTVISVFGLGFTMQIVFRIFKFEPRNVVNEDILVSTKKLFGKNEEGFAETESEF